MRLLPACLVLIQTTVMGIGCYVGCGTEAVLRAQNAEPRFEVASVKPNTSGLAAQSSQIGKGSVSLVNMRVRAMLVAAYRIRPERIEGPSWIDRDRFDIVAKAPAGTADSQLRSMIRTLLQERFRLVARTEIRDQPVYALVVGRGEGKLGSNLKPSTECDRDGLATILRGATLPPGKRPCTVITGSDGREAYITGGARSVEELVGALQGLTDRVVVDRTDLIGTFDLDLRFAAAPLATQPAAPANAPDIFAAIQEQLGLRLEPTRGPVDFLVIDHIERPTEN